MNIYVGNLSFNTEESTLQDLFGQAGPVESVRVMRDQATGPFTERDPVLGKALLKDRSV